MKKRLLSMALVCTMLLDLLAVTIPLSAAENTEDLVPEDSEVTTPIEPEEDLHPVFESAMVPFVDYMTDTIFTSYDVEEPSESVIWQYVMKHHLDEFREFIRIDDDYVEYIDEKYYVPVDVFEEYVALNFVVTDKLIDRLHLCEAYTLDGDEYVYFYQYYGGAGGPRDVVFYHGYKQLTDNTYTLYAYTVDMMEPIAEEDMTDLVEGLDYVTIDEPEIGPKNYYITGNYEMTVEYDGKNALCMTFDPADTPVLREEGVIVPETSEGGDTTPEDEELPFTLEFVSDITVSEANTAERATDAGDIYLAYDWVARGECDVFINWPDEGYDWTDPWSCNPFQIYERLGYRYGYEFEFIDSQETESWEAGNTYDAQIKIYSMENSDVCKVIDVRVTVEELNIESISAEDYSWAPYTPQKPVITVTYKDGTTSNDTSGLNIRYDDEWPTEPGTYELQMSAVNGKYNFTIKLTVLEIVSVTANPLTYTEVDRNYAAIEFTATFENGETYIWKDEDTPLPSEVGEHVIEVSVLNDTFTVPVYITVTPTLTTGVWAEGFTWDYDKTSGAVYIRGNGKLPAPDNIADLKKLPVRHFIIDEGIEAIADGAICGFSYSLQSFILPKSLNSLPKTGMFFDCSLDIEKFIIQGDVTSITHYPFASTDLGCVRINELYLPASVTVFDMFSIPTSAGSEWLTVFFSGTKEQWEAVDTNYQTLQQLYLADGLYSTFVSECMYPKDYNSYMDIWMSGMVSVNVECEVKYTLEVIWEDENGNIIHSEKIEIGSDATNVPEVPVKEGFTGKWSADAVNVTTHMIIKPQYTEDIVIENGTAIVPDSVVDVTEGEDVVIDVKDKTEEGETKVDSVVIGSATVDKITNANTGVEIKLPDATVSFDKEAIGSIGEQSDDKDVTIIATEIQKEALKPEQIAALEEKEVHTLLRLEAYAGETKLTQFDGGKVTVSVPFELPEGKEGAQFYVAYIADDGTITVMPTSYDSGVLTFETTHFSSYVVLEGETVTVTVVPDGSGTTTGEGKYESGANVTVSAVADAGYLFGGWYENGTLLSSQATYTFTAEEDRCLTAKFTKIITYFVEHYKADSAGHYPSSPTNKETFSAVEGATVTATAKSYSGYCLNTLTSVTSITLDGSNIVLKLYYDVDANGDSVPDKYQKKVTFTVLSGKWNDGTKTDKVVYVTLTSGGEWSTSGSGALSAPAVGSKPNRDFKAGSWNTTVPASVSGTSAVTYTYSYAFDPLKTVTVGAAKIGFGTKTTVSSGSDPYAPHFPSIIELQYQKDPSKNGTLIAAVCQYNNEMRTMGRIMKSTDNGATWTTIFYPTEQLNTTHWTGNMAHIYELPGQLGSYGAGTLIYSANTVNYDIYSHIGVWASTDCGATWEEISIVASGGGLDWGVWEPVMFYDNGYLYCFYSDDTGDNFSTNDQTIVYQRSSDGVNWESPVSVCAFNDPIDRPGMPVITKMGNGEYFLVYEYCEGGGAEIYYKTTSNIADWGDPADIGTPIRVTSGNNTYKPATAPSCVWSPAGGENGTLIVTGKYQFGGIPYNSIFVSLDYGKTWNIAENPLSFTEYDSFEYSGMVGYRPIMVLGKDPSVIHYINTTSDTTVEYVTIKIYDPEVADCTVTAVGDIDYTVDGNVVTVDCELACKVGYLDGDKYVAITATPNGDGTYSFTVPEGISSVTIVVSGDVNGDGMVNAGDYGRLNALLQGKISLTAEQEFAANTNGDTTVNAGDYGRLNAVLQGKTSLAW